MKLTLSPMNGDFIYHKDREAESPRRYKPGCGSVQVPAESGLLKRMQ